MFLTSVWSLRIIILDPYLTVPSSLTVFTLAHLQVHVRLILSGIEYLICQ